MKNTCNESQESSDGDTILKLFLLVTWLSLFILTIKVTVVEHLHGRHAIAQKALDDVLIFDGKMFLSIGLILSVIYLVAFIRKFAKKRA